MLKIYFYAKLIRQRQQHSTCINVSYRILRWKHSSSWKLIDSAVADKLSEM